MKTEILTDTILAHEIMIVGKIEILTIKIVIELGGIIILVMIEISTGVITELREMIGGKEMIMMTDQEVVSTVIIIITEIRGIDGITRIQITGRNMGTIEITTSTREITQTEIGRLIIGIIIILVGTGIMKIVGTKESKARIKTKANVIDLMMITTPGATTTEMTDARILIGVGKILGLRMKRLSLKVPDLLRIWKPSMRWI